MDAKIKMGFSEAERGFAYIDAQYVDSVENGPLAWLGRVERQSWVGRSGIRYVKWFAFDSKGERVGIHFATRKAAANALWSKFVKGLGRAGRRWYGLRLADVE